MFPYLDVDVIRAGPLSLPLIRLLTAAGVLLGYALLLRRARRRGLDGGIASRMAVAMVGCGFVGAHFFKMLYSTAPWRELRQPGLLEIFQGSASFGGLFAGLLGGWAYLRHKGAGWRGYFDAVAFVFPAAWVLGRFGCYLAHDHPGIRTSSWLGVAYPGGVRFDLGLIEALFTLLVMAAFAMLDRVRRGDGFYIASFLVAYGAFRMALDRLHADPVRYGGVTVDQWASAFAITAGLMVWNGIKLAEEVRCGKSCSAA